MLLNEPTYVEAAQALTRRVIAERTAWNARLVRMFRLATGRRPSATEHSVLARAWRREHDQCANGDPALAGWTAVAQLVLNLDEVLCRP